MVEKCLDNNPTARPNITAVCRCITDCKKEFHFEKDIATIKMHEQFEGMAVAAKQLKIENDFVIHKNEQLHLQQLVRRWFS